MSSAYERRKRSKAYLARWNVRWHMLEPATLPEGEENLKKISAKLYNNPRRFRRPNYKGDFVCGDKLKELQKEMARPRPSENLAMLPEKGSFELLTCVRCDMILDPNNYMVCEERGHHVCFECSQDLYAWHGCPDADKKYFVMKNLEKCCGFKQLTKGNPLILGALLNRAVFRCPIGKKRCPDILGREYAEHLKNCKYLTEEPDPNSRQCYFEDCDEIIKGDLKHLMDHYVNEHNGYIAEGDSFDVTVNFREFCEKRMVSLFKMEGEKSYLIFGSQVCQKKEVVHMWMWTTDVGNTETPGPSRASNGNVEQVVKYTLEFEQVRDYKDITSRDLIFEEDPISYNITPEEILQDQVSHVQIDLDTFYNACVESTADKQGSFTIFFRFAKMKQVRFY